MDKVMFMAVIGLMIGTGISFNCHEIGWMFILTGLGALTGGLAGLIYGDFDKSQLRSFYDIDRRYNDIRRNRK